MITALVVALLFTARQRLRSNLAVRAAAALAVLGAATAWGESAVAPVAAPRVARASAPAALPAPDSVVPPTGPSVTFRFRPSQVGDVVAQDIDVDLQIETKILQAGQVAHEQRDATRRRQRRVLTALEAAEGRATKVRADFPHNQSVKNDEPDAGAAVIQGKSYLAVRHGEELQITDLSGQIPPEQEYKLVRASLENVGKPNPIATLLADKQLAVGQTISADAAMVRPLLGIDQQVGQVKRFDLTLSEVRPAADGTLAALLIVRIEVLPTDEAPLLMTVDGRLEVEAATCRLLAVSFRGPLNFSTIERTRGGAYHFAASGQIAMTARSQYGTARRE